MVSNIEDTELDSSHSSIWTDSSDENEDGNSKTQKTLIRNISIKSNLRLTSWFKSLLEATFMLLLIISAVKKMQFQSLIYMFFVVF